MRTSVALGLAVIPIGLLAYLGLRLAGWNDAAGAVPVASVLLVLAATVVGERIDRRRRPN